MSSRSRETVLVDRTRNIKITIQSKETISRSYNLKNKNDSNLNKRSKISIHG